MKNIKTYEDYIKESYNFNNEEDLNENWKKNILMGLIGLLSFNSMATAGNGNGNVKSTYDPETKIHHSEVVLTNPKSVDAYIKNGWKLESMEVDTIYTTVQKQAPEAEVEVVRINVDKANAFDSGKFTISQDMQDSLKSVLQYSLDSNFVLLKVDISSSTDKQGLSANLQATLKSMNLTPDNKGLSVARSNAVKVVLDGFGISDSLVDVVNLAEQGEKEIDQSSRYVYVDFFFAKPQAPSQEDEIETKQTIKKVWTLSKDNKADGTYKFKKSNSKIVKLGKIKSLTKSVKDLVCPDFK